VLSAAAIAAAKALEITRALGGGGGGGGGVSGGVGGSSEEQREKAMKEARAREIQAQIAAQMASVSSLLVSEWRSRLFSLIIVCYDVIWY
jgi:hypothetical protein